MYDNVVEKKITYHTVMQTLKQVADDKLSLVGTFLDTDKLLSEPPLLSHPKVDVDEVDNQSCSITIMLKPSSEERERVETYNTFINYANIGMIKDVGLAERGIEKIHSTKLNHFLNQQSTTSDIQDYELELYYTDSNDYFKREFKIFGELYTLLRLNVTVSLVDMDYSQDLYLLFKPKESDSETFFSTFVGQEMKKLDTKKIIDMIAGHNITGYFIGGVEVRDNKTITNMYALDTIQIKEEHSDVISVFTDTGVINFATDNIKSSFIETVGDKAYNFVVDLGGTQVTFMLG